MAIDEHTTWELETWLPAAAVLSAIVDFGPARARIWKESSHPKVFAVHATGSTWADVTEGVTVSWSRERYDWSEPGVVRLTQLDSNVAERSGTIRYSLTPLPDGTRITCDRRRTYRGTFDGILTGLFMRTFGSRVLRWQFARGLARAAAIHDIRPAGPDQRQQTRQ
ncbi:MAG: hypothetical protein V4515_09675 [Chloroflexota bacterium]